MRYLITWEERTTQCWQGTVEADSLTDALEAAVEDFPEDAHVTNEYGSDGMVSLSAEAIE